MIQNRSFRDYIASRFHSELFEVVSRYITIFSNELKLQLWQQSIAQFEDLGLSKLNVLFVYVDDQPKMKICFDVVVVLCYRQSMKLSHEYKLYIFSDCLLQLYLIDS